MLEIKSVNFTFYNQDEIKALSAKEITNPVLFNHLNHANSGGLYDDAMGPTDKNGMYL